MNSVHPEILRQPQRRVWEMLQQDAATLREQGCYLAGGTALALQIAHRESVDFDFFSQEASVAPIRLWLEEKFPQMMVRDIDAQTMHVEIEGVKVSVIMGYRYPLVASLITADAIDMADITDIALMKMLAITHRATLRDYIDLAAIFRNHRTLADILNRSEEKYGSSFNAMLSLRAMVHFDDLDDELPTVVDGSLLRDWKEILQKAVQECVQ